MRGDAIISIRPKFAEAILAGDKSVELRRRIPSLEIGTRLWIYATRPIAAVIGSVKVADIQKASPAEIWKEFATEAAISKDEYDSYFDGSKNAIAIVLEDVVSSEPIHIDILRHIWGGFHPPQVLNFIAPRESKKLSNLAKQVI